MRIESFFYLIKQRNKGVTVYEIQHFCVASFFLWKISAGLELGKEVTSLCIARKDRHCMSPFQNVNGCVMSHLFLVLLSVLGSNNVFVWGGCPNPREGVYIRCDTGIKARSNGFICFNIRPTFVGANVGTVWTVLSGMLTRVERCCDHVEANLPSFTFSTFLLFSKM